MFQFLQDYNVFTYLRISIWSQLSNNNVFYHHSDHLGSSELISDSLGNVVWHADYDAFGSVMNERGEENFTPNYTGKFFDQTSGLYYFNARWYDCELGRFTTQDPARDGVNWWIYCGGNPITFVDPDGRESEYFNYNNYVKGRLFGEANVISAGIQNFFGEIGNFASNIINGDKASLSLGLKGSLKSPVLDKGKGSASTGFRISASVQSGPCGTIKNRQNESLNKKVDTYNYYSSPDFLLENVE